MDYGEKDCYDAGLQWIPTDRCNINCEYCFSFDSDAKKNGRMDHIDIQALMDTLDRTGKVFRINFSGGGEPFLIPNIIEACKEITKKHYVSFNTNLTTSAIKKFVDTIDPNRVIIIYASLHIKELEKQNLLDMYIENFHLCQKNGFKLLVYEVAYPPLLDEVKKYKQFFKEKNIKLYFINYIGNYGGKDYPASYTDDELRIFGIHKEDTHIYNQSGTLCNAGYNVGIIYPNGDITSCYGVREKLGNIYDKLTFHDQLTKCPVEFCGCPFKVFDKALFDKAMKETRKGLF